jgi:hypothetical protein
MTPSHTLKNKRLKGHKMDIFIKGLFLYHLFIIYYLFIVHKDLLKINVFKNI